MTLIRNWDIALLDWALSLAGKPLKWGETDCGCLVYDAMSIIFEENPLGRRPSYKTLKGAAGAHKRTGGVVAVLEKKGAKKVGLTFLRQGDVVVESGEDVAGLPGAGIFVDGRVLVVDHDSGVMWFPVGALPEGSYALRLYNG